MKTSPHACQYDNFFHRYFSCKDIKKYKSKDIVENSHFILTKLDDVTNFVFLQSISMKFLLLVIILLSYQTFYGQPQSPEKRAEAFFRNGFADFQLQNYQNALLAFDKVNQLKENRFTQAANYYAGLCYYHTQNYAEAIKNFQAVLDNKLPSKFKEDAEYHKGLSMLKILEKREGGLYVLMELEEKTSNYELKQDIRNAIASFLFSSRLYFLKKYFEIVRKSYKPLVAEAIAYQYYLEKQYDSLATFIANCEKQFSLTTNLSKFKYRDHGAVNKTDVIDTLKIAVVLPFNSSEYSDTSQSIKIINRYAVEFLTGLTYGLENKEFPNIQKIILKPFDSQKDSNYIKNYVLKELDKFAPQIIIGEFLASHSQILANYCENRKILLLIPFANSENLIVNKNHVFLQNATLSNQTAVVAKWLKNNSEFKNIVGIFDDHNEGKKSADIFQKELDKTKKTQILYFEHQNWKNSLNQISSICLDPLNLVDCVFMNVQKQEHFELLLNHITRSDTTPLTLVTVNEIKNFHRIDGKKWFYFNTIFTQFYAPENRSSEKEKIYNLFFTTYKFASPIYFYQGMDVVEIITKALTEKQQGKSWKESFSEIKPFEGYNQNYFFGQSQSNQSIKLYQFQKDGVKLLDIW